MTADIKQSSGKVALALILDTFQEARARWLFWGLFGLSSLLIAIFLFVLRIDIVQGAVSLMGIQATSHAVYDIQKFVQEVNYYSLLYLFLLIYFKETYYFLFMNI